MAVGLNRVRWGGAPPLAGVTHGRFGLLTAPMRSSQCKSDTPQLLVMRGSNRVPPPVTLRLDRVLKIAPSMVFVDFMLEQGLLDVQLTFGMWPRRGRGRSHG